MVESPARKGSKLSAVNKNSMEISDDALRSPTMLKDSMDKKRSPTEAMSQAAWPSAVLQPRPLACLV